MKQPCNFPEETDALKYFFSGAAQEFTANLFGSTKISQEAMIGTAIGTLFAPGIGSIIGGAVGGWLGGNKQQKALEALIEKYHKARENLFQAWEELTQTIYSNLSDYLKGLTSIEMLTYEACLTDKTREA